MQRFVNASAALAFVVFAAPTLAPAKDNPPALTLSSSGPLEIAFKAGRDGCDGHDVPDAPLRAYRDANGQTIAFGLHFVNRRLRGPAINKLKIDCTVVLNSGHNGAPQAYDDYNWITATWTDDGRKIAALIHHEYHGNEHRGQCRFKTMMQCWMNTITAWHSNDGGKSFSRHRTGFVVAAAPFTQAEQQGRHRGFFNPSNIVSSGKYKYFFASQTGWQTATSMQKYGVCLFRTIDPHRPDSWRAWDGKGFSVRYADPYVANSKTTRQRACKPIAPFPAPVGSLVRHRPTGQWLAVFQASADKTYFPLPGIYFATAKSLTQWSTPRLLIAGKTLYDDPCKSGGRIISYPSLISPGAQGRNYDDTTNRAFLFYASMQVKGCTITANRDLISMPVSISKAQ